MLTEKSGQEKVDVKITVEEILGVVCLECQFRVKALMYDKTREAQAARANSKPQA